jgi:polysaccharide chain length determinant protein (PEP-CTERM system associated)
MVANGEISIDAAKRVLRRFWWILPITVVTGTVLALTAALTMPKKYTSTTLVLVEQPTVPTDYVKPVVNTDLSNRLASMKQQILSTSRLQPIIEKYSLYPGDRQKLLMDDRVEKLRQVVEVAMMEPLSGSQGRAPGFRVAVTFDNPRTAQQICSELTSMFMEQNAADRGNIAKRTTDFISQQLEDAKARLDQQDAAVAQFKREHMGVLPDETQSNIMLLNSANSQLDSNTEALTRLQQDKALNQGILDQQEATWKSLQIGHNPETQQQLVNSQEQQLVSLEEQLAILQNRYTPRHPDVVKLKAQIEELKQRVGTTPKAVAPDTQANSVPKIEPPQIQQLRARIRQDDLNIADLTKQQASIQERIHVLQARVESSPAIEQQFKEATRNYQTALDFYNELLRKQQNSMMATDLEHQQDSETFRVLDPPSLPAKPSSPKVPLMAGAGFGGGLMLGLAILYLLAITDRSYYNEREVEASLRLPVLTTLPELIWSANGHGKGDGITGSALPVERSA